MIFDSAQQIYCHTCDLFAHSAKGLVTGEMLVGPQQVFFMDEISTGVSEACGISYVLPRSWHSVAMADYIRTLEQTLVTSDRMSGLEAFLAMASCMSSLQSFCVSASCCS